PRQAVFRPEGVPVEVYNDGLLVFLYDEVNGAAIRESGVDILTGFGDDTPRDRRLKDLAAKGMLVAYELQQDDNVRAEVIVGRPLSREEMACCCWHLRQRTLLSLPSGRLCIESYNSLRIGPEEPGDEGAVVKVPPGDYLLTLHRIDWEAMEN